MANALVPQITNSTPSGDSIIVEFIVVFYGADLARSELYTLSFSIAPGDTVTTIRNNWVGTIRNLATVQGVTLPTNSILLPSFQRG